ncbi:dihydrolipoyl dehydrogenase [Hyphobacterium sp. HN65]|uniref:Dihydrolipoyl dehydrogenase n=1 Tax=Hyphobacterium lacteum TaxID=3116575 RepID=A0ABU7LQD8_9PROT|nr:dihydrolipoyl dehydrogenase [Hyphobacterium sp. HN65]MEE2526130.1 dihydrolipoyl dehydrogenase [Hyphobacterium sp. HN65]
MSDLTCDVLVVGGGPGGYPAAIRAGQLGLDTIIVDKDGWGGTCLNRGCIPSKAFIHAAEKYADMVHHAESGKLGISLSAKPKLDMKKLVGWKDEIVGKLTGGVEQLLKAAGVKAISGWAEFEDAKTCTVTLEDGKTQKITAKNVILANGSVEVELPFLPFKGNVIGSTGALDLKKLPKKLVVVGGGYIGLELGIAYRKLGSEVTFVEALDRILPVYDKELTRPITRWLKENGVTVHTSCKAKGVVTEDKKTFLEFETAKGETERLEADNILVSVGRKPNLNGWGLEKMGIPTNGKFIEVNERCETGMRGVYALGDLTGEPLLAHRATAQGERVAEIIAGHKTAFDPVAIAAVCFTEPEVVGVGLTPDEAKEKGETVITGKFPLAANGRYLSMEGGADGGFVRITARESDHVILGIHAVGKHVSELSGEFALAMEMGARLEDIAGTVHVHPTLTEGLAEAALVALGHPIHISAPKK